MIILRGCAKQVVVEGGGVVGAGWGGVHKGGAAAVYKMLITPTTKASVVILETAPQSW